MIVEVVELDQGRSVADLAVALKGEGGALVVLKWRRGNPTLASLFLPDDSAREARCRDLLSQWREAPAELDTAPGGFTWPVGHPRHQFDLGVR